MGDNNRFIGFIKSNSIKIEDNIKKGNKLGIRLFFHNDIEKLILFKTTSLFIIK